MKSSIIITLFCLVAPFTFSQTQTVGLRHQTSTVSDGFVLFSPDGNNSVYLIDNCGEKINEWAYNEGPGLTAYLLPNGNLLRSGKDSLQIRNWNNQVVWTYATTANGFAQHHDIEALPNGNILMVVNDAYTAAEAIAQGRDSTKVGNNFRLDKIVELQPVGSNSATVVWEWSFKNHLIQDYDASKPNFGIVYDFPELLDLNYDNANNTDWTHVNSVDHNPQLDQIIISARHLSEIYIIDHSTSMSEAAGHTGGVSGKGGDFLWRWGNPAVYRRGTGSNQKLYRQHDAQWVKQGYADEGKITVFNNDGDSTNTFSSVHLIQPTIVAGEYQLSTGTFSFEPQTFDWSWSGNILGRLMKENKKCGVHSLVNGNILITESSLGQFSEITKNGEHLWTYRNPTGSAIIFNQGDNIALEANSVFRSERIPSNYIGFSGKDMTPKGIIENQNSKSDSCSASASIAEIDLDYHFQNPATDKILSFYENQKFDRIQVLDHAGKLIFEATNWSGKEIQLNAMPGLYILSIQTGGKFDRKKFILE